MPSSKPKTQLQLLIPQQTVVTMAGIENVAEAHTESEARAPSNLPLHIKSHPVVCRQGHSALMLLEPEQLRMRMQVMGAVQTATGTVGIIPAAGVIGCCDWP